MLFMVAHPVKESAIAVIRNRIIITTLLIDADIVAFKFASTGQEVFKWDDGTTSIVVQPLEEVTPAIDAQILAWKERWKADEVIVCLSCPHEENFRLSILPTYKGNRDYTNRPALLSPIKQYLAENYRTFARPTLEADDVMGILSTHPTLVPGRKVIVSEDKDMKTIPGFLWNPAKDRKPWKVSEQEADFWHLYQTLIGDSTDHYAGCPGVGPVTAHEALTNVEKLVPVHREITRGKNKGTIKTTFAKAPADSLWEVVVSYFHSKGLTEEDALVQARVARICRASDYNFKTKEVRLWNPKQ